MEWVRQALIQEALERLIRYHMSLDGYEPSADERAFISFRYYYGRDPEPWFDSCRERPMHTRNPPDPLSPDEETWLSDYLQQRRATQLANDAERQGKERRNAAMFAKAAESGAVASRAVNNQAREGRSMGRATLGRGKTFPKMTPEAQWQSEPKSPFETQPKEPLG